MKILISRILLGKLKRKADDRKRMVEGRRWKLDGGWRKADGAIWRMVEGGRWKADGERWMAEGG